MRLKWKSGRNEDYLRYLTKIDKRREEKRKRYDKKIRKNGQAEEDNKNSATKTQNKITK